MNLVTSVSIYTRTPFEAGIKRYQRKHRASKADMEMTTPMKTQSLLRRAAVNGTITVILVFNFYLSPQGVYRNTN